MLLPLLRFTGWLPGEHQATTKAPFLGLLVTLSVSWPLPVTLGLFVCVTALVGLLEHWGRTKTNELSQGFLLGLQRELIQNIAYAKWSYVQT